MPDPALLTPLGLAMVAQLPPALRNSRDYLAVIHAYAREFELLEAAIETVRAQFNPATADVLLSAWEYEVKLPVGGLGMTLDQRRQAVLARLQRPFSGEGRDWERAITAAVGPGWTYAEHVPADPGSPAEGVVRVTVPLGSGSARFTELRNHVRDITDAHLELEFESSSAFQLDVSELDVQEFGA